VRQHQWRIHAQAFARKRADDASGLLFRGAGSSRCSGNQNRSDAGAGAASTMPDYLFDSRDRAAQDAEMGMSWRMGAVAASKQIAADEHFYGFGERGAARQTPVRSNQLDDGRA